MKSTYKAQPEKNPIRFGPPIWGLHRVGPSQARSGIVWYGVFFRENRKTKQQIGLHIFADKKWKGKNLWLVAVTMRKYKFYNQEMIVEKYVPVATKMGKFLVSN